MVDVAEILEHWYAGRPEVEVAAAQKITVALEDDLDGGQQHHASKGR